MKISLAPAFALILTSRQKLTFYMNILDLVVLLGGQKPLPYTTRR